MRVECDQAGFEQNWLEIDEAWTRREVLALGEADEEELLAILRRKVTACNIERVGGEPVTDPAQLDEDTLLDADEVVWGWLARALYLVIGRRRSLGNLSARLLSAQNGATAEAVLS